MEDPNIYTEKERQEINLKNHRMRFEDIDRNNRNLETKTNYLIAINVILYSLFAFILGSASFNLFSKIGTIIIVILTIFITIDFVLVFKNLAPTGFRQIPHCLKDQNKELYSAWFSYSNDFSSYITLEKANCLRYLLISFFLKMIVIFILFLLTT